MKSNVLVHYTRPMTQVVLVGITCFATVGMFTAVSNLGAGGTHNIVLSDTANGVLYGMLALTSLISGGILIGPRLTLFFGTLGYALYVGSLWCYQTRGTSWFLVFSGAILGITAALLWSAQGAIMMSYPLEKDKGKAFGVFYAIYQLGAFIGAIISLAINIQDGDLTSISTTTYIVFLFIIFVGVTSAFLVLPPHRVIRKDGTIVKVNSSSKLRDEIIGMARLLKDWRVIALLPMFFASNYSFAYQASVSTARFDGPTRALTAVLESAGSIAGALSIGFLILDANWLGRRVRGFLGLAVVAVITIVVWSASLSWQLTFDRADASANPKINYKSHSYVGPGTLYFFYYFGNACYLALPYWIMSSITNDTFILARLAGIYTALQSAGAASSFGIDAVVTPFLNEHLASWGLILVSIPLAGLVIGSIKESNYPDEMVVYVEDVRHGRLEKSSTFSSEEQPCSA